MAYLINRNPSGRLLCLHGLLQYVVHHWGDGPYRISNFKFDGTKSPNIHGFSPCRSVEYGFESCIYLQNPSSPAGCGLVNSLVEDTQKSKSASDVFNALDGLGLITRVDNSAIITDLGKQFIAANRDSHEWESIARTAVQNYGPFVGMLHLSSHFDRDNEWRAKDLGFGFAHTGEQVVYSGESITLSTGSQQDTNTRTKSNMVSWGIATGYFVPNQTEEQPAHLPSQVKHHDYLMSPRQLASVRNSSLVYQSTWPVVQRPLSYHQLVKSVRSLRENGQAAQRKASIQFENVIKNRRLAIAYALHLSADFSKPLIFDRFVDWVSQHDNFVVDPSSIRETLIAELPNAFVIGTPYNLLSDDLLLGVRKVNLDVLVDGAEADVIGQLETLGTAKNLYGK